VQGYRGAIALLPDRDLGIVVLWNSTSGVPSGLMPTILDSALGLRGDWLDLDEDDVELLYASRKEAREVGSDASTSYAKPR
jgi:beta-lactamase class C